MAKHTIVAQFHDYGAAHRAFCELLAIGIEPHDISLIAGDRSNARGTDRDFGILAQEADFHIVAVRRGTTLLAVRVAGAAADHVAQIIEEHASFQIDAEGDPAPERRPGQHANLWRH